MICTQQSLVIPAPGRGMTKITKLIEDMISTSGIEIGTCNIFIHHTSASLIICENADIDVQGDMEAFMSRLVQDGDPLFKHIAEGSDDMPAHVRTILTETSINVPITNKKLSLGNWQGIYLWEHRFQPHDRRLTVTLMGNA